MAVLAAPLISIVPPVIFIVGALKLMLLAATISTSPVAYSVTFAAPPVVDNSIFVGSSVTCCFVLGFDRSRLCGIVEFDFVAEKRFHDPPGHGIQRIQRRRAGDVVPYRAGDERLGWITVAKRHRNFIADLRHKKGTVVRTRDPRPGAHV